MSTPSERLRSRGWVLPPPTPTHYSYLPALRHRDVVHVAGQIPKLSADRLLVTGVLGAGADERRMAEAVRLCVLHALSWVEHLAAGDLNAVTQVLRVNYFFQVGEKGHGGLSPLADVGSTVLMEVFGARGQHPRSVLGVRELPRNAPVLVNMDVALADGTPWPRPT